MHENPIRDMLWHLTPSVSVSGNAVRLDFDTADAARSMFEVLLAEIGPTGVPAQEQMSAPSTHSGEMSPNGNISDMSLYDDTVRGLREWAAAFRQSHRPVDHGVAAKMERAALIIEMQAEKERGVHRTQYGDNDDDQLRYMTETGDVR